MKKFFKFLCGAASMAAVGFGAYCVYKNVIAKKDDEDFDDFEDCFEDEETSDAEENREYVSINITEDDSETQEETSSDEDSVDVSSDFSEENE